MNLMVPPYCIAVVPQHFDHPPWRLRPVAIGHSPPWRRRCLALRLRPHGAAVLMQLLVGTFWLRRPVAIKQPTRDAVVVWRLTVSSGAVVDRL